MPTFRQINSCSSSISFFSLPLSSCSHLRGIISLSNPSPYIKRRFLLHLASGTRCTRCWQRHCFPQKAPSQSQQRRKGEGRRIPPASLGRYPHFFVSPLKKTGFFSELLFGECHWTKQASYAGIPAFGPELFWAAHPLSELCTGSGMFTVGVQRTPLKWDPL